jgi:hypothetical protein
MVVRAGVVVHDDTTRHALRFGRDRIPVPGRKPLDVASWPLEFHAATVTVGW